MPARKPFGLGGKRWQVYLLLSLGFWQAPTLIAPDAECRGFGPPQSSL